MGGDKISPAVLGLQDDTAQKLLSCSYIYNKHKNTYAVLRVLLDSSIQNVFEAFIALVSI
jgi:hypothetical protein